MKMYVLLKNEDILVGGFNPFEKILVKLDHFPRYATSTTSTTTTNTNRILASTTTIPLLRVFSFTTIIWPAPRASFPGNSALDATASHGGVGKCRAPNSPAQQAK